MSSTLAEHEKALDQCTYCPSLCLHTCPVSYAEARDTVSPWGKMSLAAHVHRKRIGLTGGVASIFYKCLGCGACRHFCRLDNPVWQTLFAARRHAVERGSSPFPLDRFVRPPVALDTDVVARAREGARYSREPDYLLLPGHPSVFEGLGELVDNLFRICNRFDDDQLCIGPTSVLDAGYQLWAGGYEKEFVAHARNVYERLRGPRQIVVMSPEALYTLRHVYPEYGLSFDAELLHSTEYVLPMIAGALVERVPGRVAYHDSCHLARHLNCKRRPRDILGRLLDEPPVELALNREETACCGGTGCLSSTSPETALGAAAALIELAKGARVERLVTFSPECLAMLRATAPADGMRVDDAMAIVAEAVRG